MAQVMLEFKRRNGTRGSVIREVPDQVMNSPMSRGDYINMVILEFTNDGLRMTGWHRLD